MWVEGAAPGGEIAKWEGRGSESGRQTGIRVE
jgi:hypothetical protein